MYIDKFCVDVGTVYRTNQVQSLMGMDSTRESNESVPLTCFDLK